MSKITTRITNLETQQAGAGPGPPGIALTISPSGGDDTSALQSAINANETVLLDSGTFKISSITLGNYTKLLGAGKNLTAFTRFSGTSAMIVSATYSSGVPAWQTDMCIMQDFSLDGGGVGTGINVLNHSTLEISRVRVSNCVTGFDLNTTQFCSFYSITAFGCTVGLYLHGSSGSTGGGGNSNSFYDLRCTNGTIGVIVSHAVSIFPGHSNYFRNPVFLSNTLCQFAAFGNPSQIQTNLTLDGLSNEAGATAGVSTTFDSLVVKQASIYCNYANVGLLSGHLSEGADPCIVIENQTRLKISDLDGYGHTFGQVVQADATSICTLSGDCTVQGCFDNCISLKASLMTEVGIAGPPASFLTSMVENDITTPSTTGTLTDATGTTSHTTGSDTFFGAYTQVNYAAGGGGVGSNRANFAVPSTAGRLIVTFNMISSIDALIGCVVNGDSFGKTVDLFAGQWTRMVYVTDLAATGTQSLKIFPWNAGGPVLKFCKFHARSGAINVQLMSDIDTIAAGGYNPT